ncbi:MAG: RHS repeat-associated core domain-containing protein [Chloroflexota bacterium]
MDYNARFYSQSLGKFTQSDTVIPGLTNSQNWNRLSYVNNNPVKYNDPSGHMPEWECGFAAGGCGTNYGNHASDPETGDETNSNNTNMCTTEQNTYSVQMHIPTRNNYDSGDSYNGPEEDRNTMTYRQPTSVETVVNAFELGNWAATFHSRVTWNPATQGPANYSINVNYSQENSYNERGLLIWQESGVYINEIETFNRTGQSFTQIVSVFNGSSANRGKVYRGISSDIKGSFGYYSGYEVNSDILNLGSTIKIFLNSNSDKLGVALITLHVPEPPQLDFEQSFPNICN